MQAYPREAIVTSRASVRHDPLDGLPLLGRLHGEPLDKLCLRRMRCHDSQAVAQPVTAMCDERDEGMTLATAASNVQRLQGRRRSERCDNNYLSGL